MFQDDPKLICDARKDPFEFEVDRDIHPVHEMVVYDRSTLPKMQCMLEIVSLVKKE